MKEIERDFDAEEQEVLSDATIRLNPFRRDGKMPALFAQEEEPEEIPGDTVRLEDVHQAVQQVEEPEEEITEEVTEEEPETEAAEETEETEVEEVSQEESSEEESEAYEEVTEEAETEEPEEEPEEAAEENEEDDEDDEDDEVELTYLPPLIFRPKSRLAELKRQLVAGPEKRYYELSEIGVGRVQLAMLVCFVVILISAGAAVMYISGRVPENRMRLMVFGQILAMLIGGLMGSQQMLEGLYDLFSGRFTLNTLLTVTFGACIADSVFCLQELRVPICAAFTLEVAMSLWNTYHCRTTEMGQMDTMRKAVRLDSVVKCDDYYEGKPGFLTREGQVEDFMEHYNEVSGPQKVQNWYALLSLLAAIGVAAVAGVFHGLSMAIQIFTTTLLVAVPASMFITLSRPAAVLERRLHKLGTVLCSWAGVKHLGAKGVIPLKDYDLFPTGATKMNGVKFYGDRDPEEVIAYAAALMNANGGSLAPIFDQLLTSRNGFHYDAENLQFYGNGGIGGEICGEPVLLGTLDFLKDMGVEIPEGTMVKQAIYVSIDGELSGLFAITYTRTKFAAGGLATLSSHRRVTPIIIAQDFMLNEAFLKEKFGIRNRRTIFATRAVQEELADKVPAEDAPALALTTQEGLAPKAFAITGARALRTACKLGMTIHIIGGLLGILIMLALAIVGSTHLLTPIHVLLYQLIWMAPGLLVSMWPRTV
ncbi:MAG: hypothetical protein IKJ99_06275 [Oscillospiraceae bacterium]|nr:hypothetical protein [Oscillospiraceae bacterium]